MRIRQSQNGSAVLADWICLCRLSECKSWNGLLGHAFAPSFSPSRNILDIDQPAANPFRQHQSDSIRMGGKGCAKQSLAVRFFGLTNVPRQRNMPMSTNSLIN
jgi:hypothetical protein